MKNTKKKKQQANLKKQIRKRERKKRKLEVID